MFCIMSRMHIGSLLDCSFAALALCFSLLAHPCETLHSFGSIHVVFTMHVSVGESGPYKNSRCKSPSANKEFAAQE